jgi:hypothetical protein
MNAPTAPGNMAASRRCGLLPFCNQGPANCCCTFRRRLPIIAEIIDWLYRASELHDMWRFVGLASLACIVVAGGLWAMGMDISDD